MNIKEITAVFDNGDNIILVLSECQFATYKSANLWQLSYGERHEGNYGDDVATKGAHHFMASGTEYFPENRPELALLAFNTRLTSFNPTIETHLGLRLEDFLEREGTETKLVFKERCSKCGVRHDVRELSTEYSSSYKYLCSSCKLMVSGT